MRLRRSCRRAAMLGALAALLPSHRPAAAQDTRPNIILILADDLGQECLGAYGGVSYRTPNLDRLARTGVRFDRAYAQPLCTPTRVLLMTGKWNFRNYQAFGVLDPRELTFAHILRQAGYRTCVAGKWQLFGRQEGWVGKGTRPDQAGFDAYCLWQIQERGSRYADPLIERSGRPLQTLKGRYGPDVFLEFILEFMENAANRPFFIYYPMALVHDPFVPTPDSPGWPEGADQEDPRHFAAMVEYMDKIVGRIVSRTEELGLSERTLILFAADNGANRRIASRMSDGREIQGAKGRAVEAGMLVPLIARWKGTAPEGAVCDDLIDFADFLPTLADAAGAPLPPGLQLDGRSFLEQIRGRKGIPRDWLFCHYDPRWGRLEPARFVRDRRWKLYDDGRLYDVEADPLERRPIAGGQSRESGEARERLAAALASIR